MTETQGLSWMPDELTAEEHVQPRRIIHHIAVFRGSRKGLRLLEVIYGPQALPLRTQVAALILGRKVTSSDKMAQYGNLRKLLIEMLKATGNCIAAIDHDFETKAAAILGEQP